MRLLPAAPPRPPDLPPLDPSRSLDSRALEAPPPPLDLPRLFGPFPLPPFPLAARSTRSSNSRRPCLSIESPLPPPPPPRCCGIGAAAAAPPPPWCAASLRRAASRATSARADCLRRLARRCHDCSPRGVAAGPMARRPRSLARGTPLRSWRRARTGARERRAGAPPREEARNCGTPKGVAVRRAARRRRQRRRRHASPH